MSDECIILPVIANVLRVIRTIANAQARTIERKRTQVA